MMTEQEFEQMKQLVDQMNQQWKDKLRDPEKARAYQLREEAWDCVFSRKHYNPDRALELMQEAARLDPEYEPQVQGVKNVIARKARTGKVSLKKAINVIFVPRTKDWGFTIKDADQKTQGWKEGAHFTRQFNGLEQIILIGRTKFGKALGLNVCRQKQDGTYEWLDVRQVGLTPDSLEYLNQAELDVVLKHVVAVFEAQILPWFEVG
jgi:hypothetical protein